MESAINYSEIAADIRRDIIEMLHRAGSGHAGGSLSETEILVTLYYGVLRVDPTQPEMEDRDRFILSKGHAAPGLYAVLARKGYFPGEELTRLRRKGSILQGHPDMKKTPGVDFSTGSLGQGLSAGCGMALAGRLAGKDYRVYVLLGDGELNEGQIWEAAMAAAKLKLDNLVAIVDRNHVQLDGTSDEIMPLEPLADKWRANNWHVICADGHDCKELLSAFEEAKSVREKPVVILAETVKGKGVSFMEGDYHWHGKPINDEEYARAVRELQR